MIASVTVRIDVTHLPLSSHKKGDNFLIQPKSMLANLIQKHMEAGENK